MGPLATTMLLALAAQTPLVTPNGSRPASAGPAERFTGAVRIDTPFGGRDGSRVGGSIVTFEPGARTAWHSHALGQTLIVTAGCGWVQSEGAAISAVRPGDVVWIPPNVRHWHGASARNAMSHVAIVESAPGADSTRWMEHVADADYAAGRAAGCDAS